MSADSQISSRADTATAPADFEFIGVVPDLRSNVLFLRPNLYWTSYETSENGDSVSTALGSELELTPMSEIPPPRSFWPSLRTKV